MCMCVCACTVSRCEKVQLCSCSRTVLEVISSDNSNRSKSCSWCRSSARIKSSRIASAKDSSTSLLGEGID